jgi:hypothetical protein
MQQHKFVGRVVFHAIRVAQSKVSDRFFPEFVSLQRDPEKTYLRTEAGPVSPIHRDLQKFLLTFGLINVQHKAPDIR